jgi:hypothetical protein
MSGSRGCGMLTENIWKSYFQKLLAYDLISKIRHLTTLSWINKFFPIQIFIEIQYKRMSIENGLSKLGMTNDRP